MSHDVTSVMRVKNPAKRLGEIITWIQDARNVAEDNIPIREGVCWLFFMLPPPSPHEKMFAVAVFFSTQPHRPSPLVSFILSWNPLFLLVINHTYIQYIRVTF